MTAFDPVRVAVLILAACMVAGMLWAAYALHRSRQPERADGCICTALLGLGIVVGNYQRIHEPPTVAVYISGVGVLFGLRYLAKYQATKGRIER